MSKSEAKEILKIKPSIVELCEEESNNIYMLLTMCILTNKVNYNNLEFTNDFIEGVVKNKEHYIGIPLVANRTKLENGFYNNLTHEFDKKTGQLRTDQIGSFVDFWSESDSEDESIVKLMGKVKVFKRYPNVCNALIELYESGDLEFSCEVLAFGYAEKDEETGIRKLNYMYKDSVNELFGSCVVTNPAEPMSKAELLIAEALNKDIEGGDNLAEKQFTVETFNKGLEIQYHGNFETSALKLSEIEQQIYNYLNPVNPKTDYREYNYCIRDIYTDFVIVEDWNKWNTLWKIGYQIVNDKVQLDSDEQWVKGSLGFIPEGITIDELLSQVESAKMELNELENKYKEELQQMAEKVEKTVEQFEQETKELNEKIQELNKTIVSQEEKIKELEEKEVKLNEKIKELEPYKEKVEVAEKQAKQKELKGKYEKLLSEETRKSEAYMQAIEELNETKLNELVVNEVATKLSEKSKSEDPEVMVSARQDENLLPQSRKERWYASRG